MSSVKSTAEIRESFQKYFEKQGHTRVESSSLIPSNDPTLLFTAAGMVQFKDCFLGLDKRAYSRATSAQKCVRAGGKHNDLENVGFTARHHTFFEMLGNFSFGDYFKKEAIHYAWEYTTKVLGLPKERLRVSVHTSDDESAEIWHKQEGLPLDRIVRFGEDNFWSAGDTGPCGPCTEIFWDQGQEVDGDRWLEFWNCVFMQYDRTADGKMTPLPRPSVDTGMGLERTAAILQGAPTNYDIDLLSQLIHSTQDFASQHAKRKIAYAPGDTHWEASALKVIVDHLRSTSFLIADGVLPSNEGRGYVLRRILRRAVRFGKRLGIEEPFLAQLFPSLESAMGAAYPELVARKNVITEILTQEESKFFETLEKGLHLLEEAFGKMGSNKVLPAPVVFKLYDTFGFPADLTALIAREKNLGIDSKGFDALMEEAQKKSRASWKGSGETAILDAVKEWKSHGVKPRFTGYEHEMDDSTILAVAPGKNGAWVAIDPCPFYGEGGGQAGDRGVLKLSSGKEFVVSETVKPYEDGIALYVEGANADIKVGANVKALVDPELRRSTKANHTATHLLHSALREILGKHVEQAGSLVNAEKLRFDFSHPKSVNADDLRRIEEWVNHAIEQDISTCVESTSYDNAIKKGAMALFGEKYGDVVRMIQIPGFSTELCGGTHVRSTGEIRVFKIISESAVAAGTRRIEAITSSGAMQWYKDREKALLNVATTLRVTPDTVEDRVTKLLESQRDLEREIESLKRKLAQGGSALDVLKGKYKTWIVEIHALEGADSDFLRQKGDAVRKANPAAIHVVISNPLLLVTLEPSQLTGAHAGNLLKELATALGGRGGGQGQTAQGQIPAGKGAKEILEWISKA